MTQNREGGVEILAVTQADREAAAQVYSSFRDHDFATWIRNGSNASGDHNSIIQMFARHRIAYTPTPSPEIAEQPMGEVTQEAAAWLRECSAWMLAKDLDMGCPMESDPLDIADRLDALTPKPADPTSVAGERMPDDGYSAEDEALYTRWLAGDGALRIEREQYLRFQARIDRETRERAR